ncbi:MAG TPA: BACON domain-containing carbohydrate-binding protein [Pyrinomonadaceae bacterium]|jgi:hypothetical protein
MSIFSIFNRKLGFTFLAVICFSLVVSASYGTIGSSSDFSLDLENPGSALNSLQNSEPALHYSKYKSFNFLNNNIIKSLSGSGSSQTIGTKNIASSLDDSLAPVSIYFVNNTGDTNDMSPTDGACMDATGNCTLRAAIQQANATAGPDEIRLSFTTPTTIQLSSSGGLVISEAVTIVGPSARLLTVRGNANTVNGVFKISYSGTTVTSISGITVSGSDGHGINNEARLNLTDVALKQNGYGIYNTGTLNLNRLLINGNTSGGIYISSSSVVNISNTTISGNISPEHGAGIRSLSANVTLNNVTITKNTATTSGGGIYYGGQGPGVYVRNTIIAENTAPASAGPDVYSFNNSTGNAKFLSLGNNLIGKATANSGFDKTTDKAGVTAPIPPLLGNLQNNGGQTDTHALLTGSPAKDAGNLCVTTLSCVENNPSDFLTTDQRGENFTRNFGSVDIGAFESFYPAPAISSLSPNNYSAGGSSFELTINGSNFVADSVVEWKNQTKTDKATTFVSNTQIKATILASDVATPGTYQVSVRNPQPGGSSAPVDFTVQTCSFAIDPAAINFAATGGTGTVAVTTSTGCSWTAASSLPWISVTSGSSGSGSGMVSYSVAANTGSARAGSIIIGGQTFTINQQPSNCSYTLSSVSANSPAAGLNGTVNVTTTSGCNWNVVSAVSWITVTGQANRTGSGSVQFTVTPNPGPARSGTITIAGQTFTVDQQAGCSYALSTGSSNPPAGGGSDSFNVIAGSGCAWTAVSNASWINITAGTSGNGNGTVQFTVSANNTTSPRTGTMTVGGQTFTVNQPAGCSFTLSSVLASSPASGSSGSVTVTPSATGCTWTAVSNDSWITVAGGTGVRTGNGTVQFTVAANTGTVRSGTITIANQTFTVTQANGCSYSLSAASTNIGAAGGAGSFNVNSGTGCTWSAASNESWITITTASGSGNGAVQFTVAANASSTRTGTITVNGQTHTITQANGCTFSIAPSSKNFNSAGGTGSFAITASDSGCAWTATTSESWITVNNATGTGSGTINYTVQANTGIARSGTITVGGKTYSVTQELGCTITLTPDNTGFDAAGGSGSFNVTTSNTGCSWSATASDSWINVTTPTGTGNGTVNFTVGANVTPQRTGTITIGGKTFSITQANGCAYNLSSSSTNIAAAGGTGTFNVNSGAGCTWTAVTSESWITISNGGNRSGTGAVNFSVAANNGPARSGTITVNGKTFTVNQASGCVFNLSQTTFNISAGGGTGTVNVSTVAGCQWNAASNVSWIRIQVGISGTGDGFVQFIVDGNISPSRSGTLTIGGVTVTVNQDNGCNYILSATTLNINEEGGNRSVNLTAGPGCTWNAASNADWISITGGASGNGNGTISFSVQPTSGADRNGTITIAGQTFTVNQVNLIVRNLNDSGPGSLRQAVKNANNMPGNDVITISLAGTITLTSGEITIINNGSLEIRGSGAELLKISGNNNSRIFYMIGADVTISGVTLMKGNGVGIESTENYKVGGAIYAKYSSLKLNRVYVTDNTISVTNTPGSISKGGGIFNDGGENNIIRNSTFSKNKAIFGGGYYSQSNLTIENSTFSGNIAEKTGGGIHNIGELKLYNTTITNNSSNGSNGTGGGVMIDAGRFFLGNTIIAGNNGPEITYIAGQFFSQGWNLIGDSPGDASNTERPLSYHVSDIFDTDPMLSPLSFYGGSIPTHALLVGSPAINAGNNAVLPVGTQTDQRGSARILSGTVDIGAVEYNIGISPTSSILPNGEIDVYYQQELKASRIGQTDPFERFTYRIADGFIPEGLNLSPEGFISGYPSKVGVYTFVIQAIPSNDMVGVNKYTIAVGCSYSLDQASQSISSSGGNGTVNLTAPTGCTWTANTNVDWITITNNTPAQKNGSGPISFSVQPNTGAARTGTITMGGKTFTVNQASGCVFALSSAAMSISSESGTGNFNVSSGTGCSWNASSNAPWISITAGSTGSSNGTVSFTMQANSGAARAGTITVAGQTFTVNQAAGQTPAPSRSRFDFDGDGKSDLSIYRPAVGEWWYLKSSNGGNGAFQFGSASDKIVPADYTGDGKTDIAFFRPSTGEWYILRSEDFSFYSFPFGTSGDIPAPADYDGDGRADAAVFRPSNTTWYISKSTGGTIIQQFGAANDVPVVADYDKDGRADIAIYRPSLGEWWISRTTAGGIAFQFGSSTDKPVPGDYTGDGKTDVAFFRPSSGEWFILRSEDNSFYSFPFGANGDIPSAGDYDGDGKTDAAVFRPSNSTWYVQRSASGTLIQTFGQASDKPVPNAFVP